MSGIPSDLEAVEFVAEVVPEMRTEAEAFDAAIDLAFQRASDLSRYTDEDLSVVTRWVVHVEAGFAGQILAEQLDVPSVTPVGFIDDTYFYEMPDGLQTDAAVTQLETVEEVEYFYPLVGIDVQRYYQPNDPYLDDQWHLINTSQTGGTTQEDVNIQGAWDQVSGNGVVIAIVDDSLQHDHPDLAARYRPDLAWDYRSGDNDPYPVDVDDNHGTSVAGVAAAVGDNGVGVTGSGYGATITGIRLIGGKDDGTSLTDDEFAQALGNNIQEIDIFNNSWGPGAIFGAPRAVSVEPLRLAAIKNGVTNGRGGLGSIYTFAAGNGLQEENNANDNGTANLPETIAVSAIDHNGQQAVYSEPGANILVTAHSNSFGFPGDPGFVGIVTADRTGDDGYNETGTADDDLYPDTDYTETFGGTSSATPLVSGIIALMLEANPGLNYRDVQHILVETARKNDPNDADWAVNGADHDVNHKYGFGAIDATAAVEAAAGWQNVWRLQELPTGTIDVNGPIGDNDGTFLEAQLTINSTQELALETVQVTVRIDHSYAGDLDIELESPAGTVSRLSEQVNYPFSYAFGDDYTDHTFSTVHNWGESIVGDWKLRVYDGVDLDSGTLNSYEMIFLGTIEATGFVEGYKFEDLNGNNQRDVNEIGLPGFLIFADANGNLEYDPGEPSATTQADGFYQLPLQPGTVYTIMEQQQAGYSQTFPAQNSGSYPNVVVQDQETLDKFHFGNDPDPFSIVGTKWADLNGDGKYDEGEPGIGNIEIYLDLNSNGVRDDGEPWTLTDLNGDYRVTADLGGGTFTVAEVQIVGLEQTFPASGTHNVTVVPGGTVTGIHFGNKPIPGSLEGVVRYDADGDGAHDTSERVLAGVTVFLDLNNDGLLSITEPHVVTGSDGRFRFDDLFPGSYVVRQGRGDMATQTFPADMSPWPVTILPQQVTRGVDFANHPESDFGDAPARYPTTLQNGGAEHSVLYGYHLGEYINGENDGLPEARAAGETAGDDGVVFVSPLIPGESAMLEVTLTQEGLMANRPEQGYLHAWVDFNGDGDWSDPGEHVLRNRRLARGARPVKINVPSGAVAGPTFARFRLGLEPNLGFGGPSMAGEVEDYEVVIQGSASRTGVLASDSNGDWVRSISGPAGLITESWGSWEDLGPMTDVVTGDFTGDGAADVAGRDAIGRWFVNKSTPGGMVLEHWGRWTVAKNWLTVTTGDFNDDGKMDVVGRNENGKWVVAYSNGSGFSNGYIGRWTPHVGYHDVMVEDFTDDGVVDILAITDKGDWRLGEMQNDRLVNQWVGKWGTRGDPNMYTHVLSGDFNNDGLLDVMGINKNGKWVLGRNDQSTGVTKLVNEKWDVWSTSPQHVISGDFIGDGYPDILGMDDDGRWTIAYNPPGQNEFFSIPYGQWAPAATWETLLVSDFDQDGNDDVLGLNDVGQWQLGRGGGQTELDTQLWGEWDPPTETWNDIALALFS